MESSVVIIYVVETELVCLPCFSVVSCALVIYSVPEEGDIERDIDVVVLSMLMAAVVDNGDCFVALYAVVVLISVNNNLKSLVAVKAKVDRWFFVWFMVFSTAMVFLESATSGFHTPDYCDNHKPMDSSLY